MYVQLPTILSYLKKEDVYRTMVGSRLLFLSLCKSDALLAIKNAISSCLEAASQPAVAFLVHTYVALPHFICIWEPSMYCLCSSNSIVAESAD